MKFTVSQNIKAELELFLQKKRKNIDFKKEKHKIQKGR